MNNDKHTSLESFEQCIKCTVCTVYCPMVAVNPDYPGPKQAGPDGERYRLKNPLFYDEASAGEAFYNWLVEIEAVGKDARGVIKWICGLQPWPVATAELDGTNYKIFAARYTENHSDKGKTSHDAGTYCRKRKPCECTVEYAEYDDNYAAGLFAYRKP